MFATRRPGPPDTYPKRALDAGIPLLPNKRRATLGALASVAADLARQRDGSDQIHAGPTSAQVGPNPGDFGEIGQTSADIAIGPIPGQLRQRATFGSTHVGSRPEFGQHRATAVRLWNGRARLRPHRGRFRLTSTRVGSNIARFHRVSASLERMPANPRQISQLRGGVRRGQHAVHAGPAMAAEAMTRRPRGSLKSAAKFDQLRAGLDHFRAENRPHTRRLRPI